MKNKVLLIIILLQLTGCKKGFSLEEIIINKRDDYWVHYSQEQSGYIYFQFHDNGTFDKFNLDLNDNFIKFNNDGDIVDDYRVWSVSKDSILNWRGHKYDIVNINEHVIVLMYEQHKTKVHKYKFLIKENKNSIRNSPYFYEQKRKTNPDKYVGPYD